MGGPSVSRELSGSGFSSLTRAPENSASRGLKIRLQGQPVEILSMLLARPGELVTREELQKRLWPGDTFVDFDPSLNAAVKRLRSALGDSAETPRFIETLARRGYRFLAPVDTQTGAPVEVAGCRSGGASAPRRRDFSVLGCLLQVALAAIPVVALGVALFSRKPVHRIGPDRSRNASTPCSCSRSKTSPAIPSRTILPTV